MATQIAFISAILFVQAATLVIVSSIGRHIMSAQEAIDAVVRQLAKAKSEIVAKIVDLNDQIAAAGVQDQVDTSELVAAAQSLDDIVPDAPEVTEELPAEAPAD